MKFHDSEPFFLIRQLYLDFGIKPPRSQQGVVKTENAIGSSYHYDLLVFPKPIHF